MLMMRVVVVGVTDERVSVSLSLPPGFHFDQVIGSSLRANDQLPPVDWREEPRSDRVSDLFRGFRVNFAREPLCELLRQNGESALRITGSLQGGSTISGWCPLPANLVGEGERAGPRRGVDAPPGDR
jgi:hypothetical protein